MKLLFSITFGVALLIATSNEASAQCDQDPSAIKYKGKVEAGENVQQCSQCAVLAIYLCSATYTSAGDNSTRQQVQQLIDMTRGNIKSLGRPYCCDELLTSTIRWGSKL